MDGHVLIRRIAYILLIILVVAGIKAFDIYKKAFTANIFLDDKNPDYLYIPTGSKYADVLKIVDEKKFIRNKESFDWTAHRKNYPNHIKAGKYKVKNRMSNNELINILRSGKQELVQLSFNNIRTLGQLAERISEQIEINQSKLLDLLNSQEMQAKYGLDQSTMICIFIPNTYEFFWNTSEMQFIERMHKEYISFWNKDRLREAGDLKMTKEQVMTLASIVNEETDKNDEKSRIAGVYINRLKKGIRLQADPTVIYVVGDFSYNGYCKNIMKSTRHIIPIFIMAFLQDPFVYLKFHRLTLS